MNTPGLDSHKRGSPITQQSRHFRDGLKKVLRRVLLNEGNAELSFVESRLTGKSCEILQISFGKFDKESVSLRATVREST
jgi:hypothetical protein